MIGFDNLSRPVSEAKSLKGLTINMNSRSWDLLIKNRCFFRSINTFSEIAKAKLVSLCRWVAPGQSIFKLVFPLIFLHILRFRSVIVTLFGHPGKKWSCYIILYIDKHYFVVNNFRHCWFLLHIFILSINHKMYVYFIYFVCFYL